MAMAKVIEVCRVKPSSPLEETISDSTLTTKYFPLTFFDIIWTKLPPTQRVFLFKIDQLSSHIFYDTILPKLKHSLSLTLQHCPLLAGTLTWHPHTGKPVIRCSSPDDEGVLFSVAESGADFDSLVTHDFKEAKDLHALLPDFHASETEAMILSLQVTLFPGYGFSIGYYAHHASMDGVSNAMFLKSWSTTCRVGGAHPPELTPVLDRSLIHDPLDICTILTDQVMKESRSLIPMGMDKKLPSPAGVVRTTFRLTPEQIGRIKGSIAIANGPVSSFIAVCAYNWTCLVRAEEEVGVIKKEDVYLLINVDCRGRLKPPVPANYFGNCITHRFAKAKVASLAGGDHGLAVAAAGAAIKEAIGNLEEGIVNGAERWVSEVRLMMRNEKVYGCSASMRFDLYGSDFGWGRPRMVELVSLDRKCNSFSLCDGRDGNHVNVEIGIALHKPIMEAFASHFAQGLQNK